MLLLFSILGLIPLAVSKTTQVPLALSHAPLSDIPLLGFGTWNLRAHNASQAVALAIEAGYRHIDCAAVYGNEFEVGIGIRDGLNKTGLKRQDLWITSKLWNDYHAPDQVQIAIDTTLEKLGVGYLDLYHMHWPVGSTFNGNEIRYLDTWDAMSDLVDRGKTMRIGVSNFGLDQLTNLINHTTRLPAVHQMEMHPYLQQNKFLNLHRELGIHITAYSPLAGTNPTYDDDLLPPIPLLKNPVVARIAYKRSCTPAQVALSWGLSRGTSVIPKTIHADRILENFNSTKCALTKRDLKHIDELGKYHYRYSNPSKEWGLPLFNGLEDSDGRHRA